MSFAYPRIVFVALPHFFAESVLIGRPALRRAAFVVSTGEGDRAQVLDTHNLPVRGLCGRSLGHLRRALPLEIPGAGRVVPEILPAVDDLLFDMDRRARLVFAEFSPVIQSDRPGHFFLDLSDDRDAARAAGTVRDHLRRWFGFSARIGLGSNTLIAYLAARRASPGAVLDIAPDQEANFFTPLSVLLLPLPSRLKEELYTAYNVRTIGDLAGFSSADLLRVFGARGRLLYEYARGLGARELVPERALDQVRDEIEVTTRLDNSDRLARARFSELLDRLAGRLRERSVFPGHAALEVVYQDDYRLRRERKLTRVTNLTGALAGVLQPWLEQALARRIAIKKITLAFSAFTAAWWQYDLYATGNRELALSTACDGIRRRFGPVAIRRAAHLL